MKAFFVRALYGEYTRIFRENNFVAIGWFQNQCNNYHDKLEIIKQYKLKFPEHGNGRMYQNVGQIFRFWNEIKVGDIVVSTYNDGSLIIGIVQSPPYSKIDNICNFYDRINVKWNLDKYDRTQFSIPLQNTLKSSLTVFNITQVNEIARFAKIDLPELQSVTPQSTNFNEEVIYNIIKDKLIELDATEFEILVSYLLQSLGFEANQRKGGVGDGGIDFEGVLDVMGVSTTKLQVQVKRYEKNIIGEKEIRNFRGALKRDYQGTFITLSDFNKKAIESAKDEEKTKIHLINGKQFVEIFIQQYDRIIELIEIDDMNELLSKLKFKKVIIPN